MRAHGMAVILVVTGFGAALQMLFMDIRVLLFLGLDLFLGGCAMFLGYVLRFMDEDDEPGIEWQDSIREFTEGLRGLGGG